MRDRDTGSELDQMLADLEGQSTLRPEGSPPLAVIRETVYSLPYEYHFAFAEEPRAADAEMILVWAEGAMLDKTLIDVVEDGMRVKAVVIRSLPRTRPTSIVILAPLRREL